MRSGPPDVSSQVPQRRSDARERTGSRLGPFLCWAVVFADIGTSVYYAPGILYSQVGLLAGLFVSMTVVVFLLLTLKYAEVTVRFPQGGGVVTVATHAFTPWAGALGGMFILVDYFLTAAISADSGLQYLSAIFSGVAPLVLPLSVLVVMLLGILNWWGIKDSAEVSAVAGGAAAVAAFIIDVVILVALPLNVPLHAIRQAFALMFSTPLRPATLLTGFAGSFLAFSGLESISQLSPVMRAARERTVAVALGLVFVTVGLTSPLLTIFSTTLLTACTPNFTVCSLQVWHARLAGQVPHPNPNQFISELGAVAGGTGFGRELELLTAITAAALLVFASNTAIIGAYHVMMALARMRYFPRVLERRGRWRGTPTVAILLVTAIPLLVLIAVHGDINTLGDMYAFGLLGAFSLTCLSLDVIRRRERRGAVPLKADTVPTGDVERAPAAANMRQVPTLPRRIWATVNFYLGILTTLLVSIAWLTNLKNKPLATAFGGGFTLVGLAIAFLYSRYQRSKGHHTVFPTTILHPIPNALLVLLSAGSRHNEQVVMAACEIAQDRSVIFLYLALPTAHSIRILQIHDPYLDDIEAQRTFSRAARLCHGKGIRPTYFVYRMEGPSAVAYIRRVVQPEIMLAEAAEDAVTDTDGIGEAATMLTVEGVRVAQYGPRSQLAPHADG
jgi:amino acid transporter